MRNEKNRILLIMILKNITIQNLGFITHLSHEFKEGLNVVKDHRRDELSFAFRLVFNNRTPPPLSFSVGVDTRIEAEVLLQEKEYRVVASLDQREGFKLSCFDSSGADVTSEYLYLTGHSYEQDLSDVFSGDEKDIYCRFLKYANEDFYYSNGGLAKSTDGLSNIKAFRRYLRDFLDNFEPELLREGKGYEIFIKKNGRYAVRCRYDGAVAEALSQSERVLFRYLCFLRTAEFWHGFEELRNLHGIKKPLLISGFLEKLDESIDVSELLFRTEKLQRQTILITNYQQL